MKQKYITPEIEVSPIEMTSIVMISTGTWDDPMAKNLFEEEDREDFWGKYWRPSEFDRELEEF